MGNRFDGLQKKGWKQRRQAGGVPKESEGGMRKAKRAGGKDEREFPEGTDSSRCSF